MYLRPISLLIRKRLGGTYKHLGLESKPVLRDEAMADAAELDGGSEEHEHRFL